MTMSTVPTGTFWIYMYSTARAKGSSGHGLARCIKCEVVLGPIRIVAPSQHGAGGAYTILHIPLARNGSVSSVEKEKKPSEAC